MKVIFITFMGPKLKGNKLHLQNRAKIHYLDTQKFYQKYHLRLRALFTTNTCSDKGSEPKKSKSKALSEFPVYDSLYQEKDSKSGDFPSHRNC